MKLVIDRKRWIRGEELSFLLRPTDERMCCLGFYGLACGVPKASLRVQANPRFAAGFSEVEQAGWLFKNGPLYGYSHSNDAIRLMKINDAEDIADTDRETQIAAIFAKHGVEVEFV